jgi:hypothetical protein
MKRLALFCMMFGMCVSFAGLQAQHMDISGMIPEYTGAGDCASSCHAAGTSVDMEAIAKEIVNTTHWQFKSTIGDSSVFAADGDDDLSNDVPLTGSHGKATRYCGVPGAISPSNWMGLMQNPAAPFNNTNEAYPDGAPGGCARCHISNATLSVAELGSDDAWKTVDCMICHSSALTINGAAVTNAGARMPVPDTTASSGYHLPTLSGTDLGTTSAAISDPTSLTCNRCHAYAGGGYMNKRGYDYTGELGSGAADIHASAMQCTDCHITKSHKIGSGQPKPAMWISDLTGDPDNDKISCEWCHSDEGAAAHPEKNIPIPTHSSWSTYGAAAHLEKIDCQTCHIPTNAGLETKWFDQVVAENDGNGNFKRWKPKGAKVAANSNPGYFWYNGTVYDNTNPRGDKDNGKIHPFRVTQAYVPVDDASKIVIPLKLGILFNADAEISNLTAMGVDSASQEGLINLAIRKGAQGAIAANSTKYGALDSGDGTYTGTYSWEWDVMHLSVDHGVVSKENALSCADCHGENNSVLDWTALGYTEKPAIISNVEAVEDSTTDVTLVINSGHGAMAAATVVAGNLTYALALEATEDDQDLTGATIGVRPEGATLSDAVLAVSQARTDLVGASGSKVIDAASVADYFEISTNLDAGNKLRVEVTVSYDPATFTFAESDLAVARLDEAAGRWQRIDTVVDTVLNTVTFTTNRFSLWVLGDNNDATISEAPSKPLPVEMVALNGVVESGRTVTLTWNTASETNNYGFYIERSTDGEIWEEIGFVEGNGTTEEVRTYSFSDESILADARYIYRLRQVDFNGDVAVSSEVAIEVAVPSMYTLNQNYPNPFNPTTTISFALKEAGTVHLNIYNVLGQKVRNLVSGEHMEAGQYFKTFNLSDLSSGVYFYSIEVNNFSKVRKMVLMK